jgi:hypothetical protein
MLAFVSYYVYLRTCRGEGRLLGRVHAFSIPGLDCWFPSLDHDPPHIHVRRPGEWEITVRIMTTTRANLDWRPKWPPAFGGPTRSLRKVLARLVVEHRVDLLREWERKVHRS